MAAAAPLHAIVDFDFSNVSGGAQNTSTLNTTWNITGVATDNGQLLDATLVLTSITAFTTVTRIDDTGDYPFATTSDNWVGGVSDLHIRLQRSSGLGAATAEAQFSLNFFEAGTSNVHSLSQGFILNILDFDTISYADVATVFGAAAYTVETGSDLSVEVTGDDLFISNTENTSPPTQNDSSIAAAIDFPSGISSISFGVGIAPAPSTGSQGRSFYFDGNGSTLTFTNPITTPVPEPANFAYLLATLSLLLVTSRRRQPTRD